MPPSSPRWSLAVPSAGIAGALAWAGAVLPWRAGTAFGLATHGLALAHGVTVLLCALGSRHRRIAWQVQSLAAAVYLLWLAYAASTSAAQLDALYGGLGRGVAMVLVAVGIVLAALLLPTAIWCAAATLHARMARRGAAAGVLVLIALAVGLGRARAAVRAEPIVGLDRAALGEALAAAVPPATTGASAMTDAPADCAAPPRERGITILAAFATDDGAAIECVQADALEPALARLATLLGARARGRVAIDVVTASRELAPRDAVVELFAVRPGLDGVCDGARCFAPWQLVARQAFAAAAPLELLHELRFGFDPAAIDRARIDGLVRIETASFATDEHGAVHALQRLRTHGPALEAAALRTGVRAAEDYLAAAQLPDGRFEYLLDPYSGARSMAGFSIARHAGTTFALCELAEDRERARTIATAALQVLAAAASHDGALAMLHDPPDAGAPPSLHDLGDSALGTIALAACRPLVGDRFDAELAALARFLLAMQTDGGSFHPQYDGGIVHGPEPLFAVGQAVLALVLLEPIALAHPERFPPHAEIRAAVERAMDHVAHDYWGGFGADFLYLEENWHCLAARAALPHHRHDGYERFCLDYVRWKSRLVLDERDGVADDLVGGYGFGNLVLPWTAGSATFGEAAAAALALADARGEDREPIASRLRLALAFLLHHQWKDAECFACSADHAIAGAWSEHPGAPMIRIDQVQHAMAALGHGGRALGL